MGRALRCFEADGIYHVISRGSNRGKIFFNSGDYGAFIDRLELIVERYELGLVAYSLIPNHYHAIFQTPDARLSEAIRDLNGGHSRLMSSVYGREAHLFRNRFRAEHIDTREYFVVAMRYCDLNAVAAGLAEHPADWRWCSYRATVGMSPTPDFLSPEIFLRNLRATISEARAEYRAYVEEKLERVQRRETAPGTARTIFGSDRDGVGIDAARVRAAAPPAIVLNHHP